MLRCSLQKHGNARQNFRVLYNNTNALQLSRFVSDSLQEIQASWKEIAEEMAEISPKEVDFPVY